MSDRVSPLPETEQTLNEIVFTALGAASMAWDPRPTGVFWSEKAKEAGDDLVEKIKVLLAFGEPHLGLATNEQLAGEVAARKALGHWHDPQYLTMEPDRALWHMVEEPWVGKEALWQHRDFPHIYSTDRGKTWYNLNEPLDFEGNPKIYKTGE